MRNGLAHHPRVVLMQLSLLKEIRDSLQVLATGAAARAEGAHEGDEAIDWQNLGWEDLDWTL